MNKDWTVLYEKYKHLFTNEPRRALAMFGFECGIGWYDLLDTLLGLIDHHLKHNGKDKAAGFEVAQIKEKFGGLRFYVDGGDDTIYGYISFAESLSYKICEQCGTNQNVLQSQGGWIAVACKSCIDKNERLQNMEWGDGWKPITLTLKQQTTLESAREKAKNGELFKDQKKQ